MDFAKTSSGSIIQATADYCGSSKKKRRSRSKKKKSSCPCSSKKKKKSRKRSRKRSSSKKKCMRPGPPSKNPFLNFLRDFRKRHCGWSVTKIVVEGAKCWRCMNKAARQKYYKEACRMQKKGGKGRRR